DSDTPLPRTAASSAAIPAGMTSLPMPSPAMTAIRMDDMRGSSDFVRSVRLQPDRDGPPLKADTPYVDSRVTITVDPAPPAIRADLLPAWRRASPRTPSRRQRGRQD